MFILFFILSNTVLSDPRGADPRGGTLSSDACTTMSEELDDTETWLISVSRWLNVESGDLLIMSEGSEF